MIVRKLIKGTVDCFLEFRDFFVFDWNLGEFNAAGDYTIQEHSIIGILGQDEFWRALLLHFFKEMKVRHMFLAIFDIKISPTILISGLRTLMDWLVVGKTDSRNCPFNISQFSSHL